MLLFDKDTITKFYITTNVPDVVIPEGVTAIGNDAFKDAPYLKSVTIPEGVTTIGDRAFYGCYSLTEITLPETITYIGEDAFNGCTRLTTVNTLGQITKISKRTFCNCISLKSITIPQSVTRIDIGAFYACAGLTEITLPEAITYIGKRAFYKCRSLTAINTLGQNSPASDATPPNERCIAESAFAGCQSLTAVTLPEAITNIGEDAFYSCNKLVSVTIPQGLTHIGKEAFRNCNQITSLKLPDCLEVIDEKAFANCIKLNDIDIPPSVREIGTYAFSNCSITSITIPKTIDSIPNGLFSGCEGLDRIEFPDNITSIGGSAFNSCNSLREVTIPKNVKKIGKSAFGWCQNLRKVTFSRNDIEIQRYAFFECTDLITNLSIKQWKNEYGVSKLDYALFYLKQYTHGDPFFDDVKEENKVYIRSQMKRLLVQDQNTRSYRYSRYQSNSPGIFNSDTNAIVFLTQEKLLRIDEVDLILEKMSGNPEATAVLLDYKAQNFSKDILEKYETDKLNKELGLKERTVAEWKQIYRLGDDGNGGYKILGYKGIDKNVDIPAKIGKRPVTAIDDMAFSPDAPYIIRKMRIHRFNLETVIIPDSVTSIGIKVFEFCKNLNCIVYRGKTFKPEEFEEYCHPKQPNQK